MKVRAYFWDLASQKVLNSLQPCKLIALESLRFLTMPDTLVESMPGIIRGTSLLNLGVRLSPHPASDVLSLHFCSCVCNRGNSHELLQDYFSSSWRDFHRCDADESVLHR